MTGLEISLLEKAVLRNILSGEHPLVHDLRVQITNIQVLKRELTGFGFFTTFRVERSLVTKRLSGKSFRFGDVIAQIDGLKHGAGFLLYIEDGLINLLEGYSYDEKWPDQIKTFQLSYVKEGVRDFSGIPALSNA